MRICIVLGHPFHEEFDTLYSIVRITCYISLWFILEKMDPLLNVINLTNISTNNTSSFTYLRDKQTSSLATSLSFNSSLISIPKLSPYEHWELPPIEP